MSRIFQTYPMLELSRKVFTTEILYLTFTFKKKKLNPFSLDRKLSNQSKHEMIYMLWKVCIPVDFYKYLCKEEQFLYLNRKNVLYLNIAEIVWKFIDENEKNCNQLLQYVYLIVYPEIYCTTERRGFDLKSTFQLVFKTKKDNHLGKEPSNFTKKEMKHLSPNKNTEEEEVNEKIKKIKKRLK